MPSGIYKRTLKSRLNLSKARMGLITKTRGTKTHCPQGHPYLGDNVGIDIRGYKYCLTCRHKATKEFRKKYPDRLNKATNRWKSNNKNKTKAHIIVRMALKKGVLNKQVCEVCKNPIAHAHHPDYSKPLEVMWLCRKHHSELHSKMNKVGK